MACNAWRDSKKGSTTLTLTLTFGGTSTLTQSGPTGFTQTKTIAETTRTVILERAEFIARRDLAGGVPNLPPEGKFFLLSKCCCWRCRWAFFGALSADDLSFTQHRSTVYSGEDPPPTETEDVDFEFPASAVNGSFPELRSFFCRDPEAEGKVAHRLQLAADFGGAFDLPVLLDFEYTDSAERELSGTAWAGGLTLPGPAAFADADLATVPWSEPCTDAAEAWQQIHFTGEQTTEVAEDVDETVTVDATARLTAALS